MASDDGDARIHNRSRSQLLEVAYEDKKEDDDHARIRRMVPLLSLEEVVGGDDMLVAADSLPRTLDMVMQML